jgi:tetratricopeptide (TPR) repeat protein
VAVALQNLSRLAALEGRFEESDALMEESRAERIAHGDHRGLAFAQHGLAYNSALRSRPLDALERAEEGLRKMEGFVDHQVEAVLKTDLAMALVDLDRAEEARALAVEAIGLWEVSGNESGVAYAREMLGRALFDLGMMDEGLSLIEESTSGVDRGQFRWLAGLGRLTKGEAILAAGNLAAARLALSDALAFNESTGIPRAIADSLIALGAATAYDDPAEARALFERAAGVLAECGGVLSPRQARRYGKALREAGVEMGASGDRVIG